MTHSNQWAATPKDRRRSRFSAARQAAEEEAQRKAASGFASLLRKSPAPKAVGQPGGSRGTIDSAPKPPRITSDPPTVPLGVKRRLRLFLCHSSGDKPSVRALHKRLTDDGMDPWLDEEDLLPGQRWKEEIPLAVKRSDVVLVCMSKVSINKAGYIQKEISFALDVAQEQPELRELISTASDLTTIWQQQWGTIVMQFFGN